MRLIDRPLGAAALFALEPRTDERGFFMRGFCRRELAAAGIDMEMEQSNLSWSRRAGTLRGLHMQMGASAEIKLVTCLKGRIFDVVADLRPSSPSFLRWFGIELSAGEPRLLVVPKGFAHGFLTLEDEVLIAYHVSRPHDAAAERGVRFDDPALGIRWPFRPAIVSPRDLAHPRLEPASLAFA